MEECARCGHEDEFLDGTTDWYSIELIEYRGSDGFGTADKIQLLCGDCKTDLWDTTVLPSVEDGE